MKNCICRADDVPVRGVVVVTRNEMAWDTRSVSQALKS